MTRAHYSARQPQLYYNTGGQPRVGLRSHREWKHAGTGARLAESTSQAQSQLPSREQVQTRRFELQHLHIYIRFARHPRCPRPHSQFAGPRRESFAIRNIHLPPSRFDGHASQTRQRSRSQDLGELSVGTRGRFGGLEHRQKSHHHSPYF